MARMKYNEVVSLVNNILNQYSEATIRQIYYRMVSPPYQYMENTRSMYSSFDIMLTRAREEGDIDWRRIVDNTRTIMEPEYTYSSIDTFMDNLKYNLNDWWTRYSIDLWEKQDNHLIIFVEKDALARIVSEIALPYQVSVVPGRGYNSLTQLMNLAEGFGDIDKPIIVLYFGDFDPSGLDIDRSAYDRLTKYCGRADLEVIRIALTEDDIQNLPPNPTKATDSRAGAYIVKYGDRCWELDALPPDELRNRVSHAIKSRIDFTQWNKEKQRMEIERKQIKQHIAKLWIS